MNKGNKTLFNFFFFPFLFQLFPVVAPGGSCGLEDQTKLLGITAERGERDKVLFVP